TVTDAAGNHASATQVVTVEDHENPTLSAPAPVTVGTGPGATLSGTVVSASVLGTPMVNDNCPGVSVAVAGIPAGNFFPVGGTLLTYTATDAAGNKRTATQLVTVVDDTKPVIVSPASITRNVDPNQCTATVAFSPTVSDNCLGVTWSSTPASGTAFPRG